MGKCSLSSASLLETSIKGFSLWPHLAQVVVLSYLWCNMLYHVHSSTHKWHHEGRNGPEKNRTKWNDSDFRKTKICLFHSVNVMTCFSWYTAVERREREQWVTIYNVTHLKQPKFIFAIFCVSHTNITSMLLLLRWTEAQMN